MGMRFPLSSLYSMNRSKPIVELYGIDGELQWDTCELEGLPPERIATHGGGKPTMTDMGKLPKGQWDNLPEKFTAMDCKEYKIEDIHTLMSSK
jgi:hypothetical protein